jgi:hypothetical protein
VVVGDETMEERSKSVSGKGKVFDCVDEGGEGSESPIGEPEGLSQSWDGDYATTRPSTMTSRSSPDDRRK